MHIKRLFPCSCKTDLLFLITLLLLSNTCALFPFYFHFLGDCRSKFPVFGISLWLLRKLSAYCFFILFVYVELYGAIERNDVLEAEHVCIKADGNLNFSAALFFVVKNNIDDVYMNYMFKRYGARFNIYSNMGIHFILTAIANKSLALFEKLLKFGIITNEINCPNPISVLSPVIVEIFQNRTMNEYSIFKKCFIKATFWKNLLEQPIIHYVVERKDLKFCKNLITDGFHVNSRDDSGNSPVHVACRVGASLIMKELIKCNAAINTTNHANQAPFHLAAKNGHKKVFDILKCLDVNDFSDDFGKTAEDYALEHGHYSKLYVEYLPLYS